MKRMVVIVLVVAFASMALAAAPSVAQMKKHTPKAVWVGMLANLADVQGIVAALSVFDMKRVADISAGLAKREKYVSGIKRLSAKSREIHGKIAALAADLTGAAKMGDEKTVTNKLAEILHQCNACHYHGRDASRRK